MAIIGKPTKKSSSTRENLGVKLSEAVKSSSFYKDAKNKKVDDKKLNGNINGKKVEDEKLKGNNNGNNRNTNKK